MREEYDFSQGEKNPYIISQQTQMTAVLEEYRNEIPAHYCPIKFSVLGPMLWYCGLFEYQSLCGHDLTLANVY